MINRAGIDSLNRDSVLDAVVEARRGSDRCEADLLMLAAHFADLHPVPDGGVRTGHGDPTLRISNGVIGGELGGELGGDLVGNATGPWPGTAHPRSRSSLPKSSPPPWPSPSTQRRS